MHDLVTLDGLFDLGLEYFTRQRDEADTMWDEPRPTIGRVYADRMCEVFGPARRPRGEMTTRYEDVARSLQVMLEEPYLTLPSSTRCSLFE